MRTLEAKILDATHLELMEPVALPPGRRVELRIRDDEGESASQRGPATDLTGPNRHRELAWRRSHGDALQVYAGQWVVLEGEEIVAHGPRMAQTVEDARSRGIRVPYVFYVEQSRPDIVNLGL